MPAQKNKLPIDFESREKKASAVQRFVTPEPEGQESVPDVSGAGTNELPKYYFKNTMEAAVAEEAAAAIKHTRGACRCEKCFCDICALVLNLLPPNYATTEQGELFIKAANMLNIETRGKISAAVFDAIEKVAKSPAHSHPVYDDSAAVPPAQSKKIGKIVARSKA